MDQTGLSQGLGSAGRRLTPFANIVCELFDFDELILVDICKMLTCVGCGPPNIERDNVCIVS